MMRSTIEKLYINDDMKLDTVIEIMAQRCGFEATRKMYKTWFKRWGLEKYQKRPGSRPRQTQIKRLQSPNYTAHGFRMHTFTIEGLNTAPQHPAVLRIYEMCCVNASFCAYFNQLSAVRQMNFTHEHMVYEAAFTSISETLLSTAQESRFVFVGPFAGEADRCQMVSFGSCGRAFTLRTKRFITMVGVPAQEPYVTNDGVYHSACPSLSRSTTPSTHLDATNWFLAQTATLMEGTGGPIQGVSVYYLILLPVLNAQRLWAAIKNIRKALVTAGVYEKDMLARFESLVSDIRPDLNVHVWSVPPNPYSHKASALYQALAQTCAQSFFL